MQQWNRRVAYERETEVRNHEGLHFRPIVKLVDLAGNFSARLAVKTPEREADGRSPIELLMLQATAGTMLKLCADGPDEVPLVDALVALIESGFGEIETSQS